MAPATSLAHAAVPSSRWRPVALVLVVAPALLVRLWLIRHFPEPDADAPGHLGIARALLSDPTNVSVHWVYLPAYHFVLAGLLLLRMTGDTIRVANCALAALVPVLVLRYAESTAGPREGSSRSVPWMAATFCAVSPLINLLGTSAQQETLFTILVLGTVWSIDKRRFVLAGALLAFASLVRYEAWGAVVLLVALRVAAQVPGVYRCLGDRVRPAFRLPLVIATPSVVAVGCWLLAHRLREGQWFGSLRELYRYTEAQRESLHRGLLWFPVQQPLFVFGSVVALLALAGLRQTWRTSHVVPLGIYLFLLGAYVFKGALGSARYYESLTPFVALAAANGARSLGARWRWISPAVFLVASVQLASLSVQLFLWTWPPNIVTQVSAAAGGSGPTTAGDGGHRSVGGASLQGARPPAREARTRR